MRNNVDDKNNLDYDTFTILYFILLEDEVHHEQFNHSNIIFTYTLTIGNDMENEEAQAPRRNAIRYVQSSDTLIIYK